MGSRHTVGASVKVWSNPSGHSVVRLSNATSVLVGPQIESEDRFTIEHPEHADFSLPGGKYQICYQFDAASMKRVQD